MALVLDGSANTIGGLAVGGVPDNTIDNGCLADDAVGIADLSATGTASSSTFLRGDNAWAAVTAPTGWERVTRSVGLTGDQDIETTALFDGTYNHIVIYIEHGIPSVDDVDVGVRFKINGSGWVTDSDYSTAGQARYAHNTSASHFCSEDQDKMSIFTGLGNAADEWYSLRLDISNHTSNVGYKMFEYNARQWRHNGHLAHITGVGGLQSLTNPLEGVRIYGTQNGNMGTTTISTYGLKL